MKLLIILSVVACSYAAKLDRTYLPPASAATAGGSPGSLSAPGNGPSGVTSGSLAYTGSPSGNIGPGQSSFGKYLAPTLGQQSVSSFGQPDISITNQPTGQELNQPSTFGFQTSSSQYKRPEGETGFGKPNTDGSTFAKTPAGFNQTPTSFGQSPQEQIDFQRYQPERARASIDKNAEILRYDNQNDGETFAYSFETSNGISAEESGIATNGVRAQGSFAYIDDDGQIIRVTYTADENGYQPQGDHLPTPPPIPEEILRSIEQNARAAAAGTQEGAYNPDENVYTPQQFNGVASTYQDQGRGVSQNTYPQSQGQSSTSQFGSPSFIGSDVSRKTLLSGSPNFQGPNKPSQSAPGFTQNGDSLTQSGYQYSQPQATAQFGRPSASSSQTTGQYRPESAPSGQPQGSLVGSSPRVTDKGFAPSGSNGQASVRPSAGFSPSAKPKASITEPIATFNGFGQSPSASATKGSGQYQPSQSDSGSSMPAQSSPYQYNRPGQKTATPQQTATQPSFSSTDEQSSSTQNFGAPRQPPSFTDEEGYKY